MKCDVFGRILAGPVGSGKTTACIIELLRRAMAQSPGPDGHRYTRFAIVRQTLKQLKDTVLKDCDQFLATAGLGQWKVSDSTYYVQFNDVRSEWPFIPLENAEEQARLLSMQLTGSWLSECIEMDFDVLGPVSGRIGRYPAGPRGEATWNGIIADTNMPTEGSAWQQFMENTPPDWQKFVQPSGMAPNAENLINLLQTDETRKMRPDDPRRIARGREYYERLVRLWGENSDWVRRYVYAEYGNDPSGAAVFKESFRASVHTVDDTLLIPGYPILIGQDFGRSPWSLIAQMDHMGRLLVHEEVPAANIGLEKHVVERLRPRLWQKYSLHRVAVIGDPAGVAKGSVGEESCFDALKRLGLPAYPAPTNDIDPRLRAVEALLGRQIAGGAAILISRKGCPHLCRAMGGGYRFKKTKEGALRPKPDKDDPEGFSHVADTLQYLALIVHGGLMPTVSSYLWPPKKLRRPKFTSAAWT